MRKILLVDEHFLMASIQPAAHFATPRIKPGTDGGADKVNAGGQLAEAIRAFVAEAAHK